MPQRPLATSCCEHTLLGPLTTSCCEQDLLLRHAADNYPFWSCRNVMLHEVPRPINSQILHTPRGQSILGFWVRGGANQVSEFGGRETPGITRSLTIHFVFQTPFLVPSSRNCLRTLATAVFPQPSLLAMARQDSLLLPVPA